MEVLIFMPQERANEWDYAAGHAVAENAGAIITTLDKKLFYMVKKTIESKYINPKVKKFE